MSNMARELFVSLIVTIIGGVIVAFIIGEGDLFQRAEDAPPSAPTEHIRERPTAPPVEHPTDAAMVTFSIGTALGVNQYAEVIDVYVGGRFMGRLNVSQQFPSDRLHITVAAPGLYAFELRSTTTALSNMGTYLNYNGYGYGEINVVEGRHFDVWLLDPNMTPWSIGLIEN